MADSAKHPAVMAGLISSFCILAPQAALGRPQTLEGVEEFLLGSGYGSFLVGCATGVVATGAVWAASSFVSQRRARQADSHLTLDATSSLDDFDQQAVAGHETAHVAAQNRQGSLNASGASSISGTQHYHVPAVQDTDIADKAAIKPGKASVLHSDETSRRARLENLADPSVPVPSDELEQMAQSYASHESLTQRMAQRARGVASVLAERLGQDKMEGIPVIERADGSVGDVGTSWWNARLGDSVRIVGNQDDSSQIKTPAEFVDADAREAVYADPEGTETAWRHDLEQRDRQHEAEEARRRAADERSMRIARSVAPIDEGVYPEHRDSDDVSVEDDWDRAIKAMDERIQQIQADPDDDAISQQNDVTAGLAGQDDPTSFIPFRVPGGHPEVVDADSYVDYLIDEEFSHNSSQAARRSSRDYLRVIQGGSQKIRRQHRSASRTASQTDSSQQQIYRPRHMATQAMEA